MGGVNIMRPMHDAARYDMTRCTMTHLTRRVNIAHNAPVAAASRQGLTPPPPPAAPTSSQWPSRPSLRARARTDPIGAGKRSILPLLDCVRIRTGERGSDAIS